MNRAGKPLRVLHVVDRLDRRLGGSVYAAFGICKYLVDHGVVADIAGSYEHGDELAQQDGEFSKIRVHAFRKSFPARYANSAEFIAWLQERIADYDLVEIHAIFALFTWRAARVCRQHGKPYIVRPHGSLDPFDLRKHAALKQVVGPPFIRPMLQSSVAVVLTAELEARRLVTYGARVQKHVMPLPVALPAMQGDGTAFRAKWGIPADAKVVLFMSRIDYKKGLDFLIPAIGRLKPDFPRLWFVLAGSGESNFKRTVDGWLDQAGVRSFTSTVGFVSGASKADALAAADVFALPSLNENFGIVVVEALHAGLPVLVSNEVYISAEIAGASAGTVCEPTTQSVETALRGLLNDQPTLVRMGQQARQLVQSRFSPDASTTRLIDLYADIARTSTQHE